jgi:hypothetical protein
LAYCSNVPEAVATRYWDLAAMAVMIAALLGMGFLHYLLVRRMNNESVVKTKALSARHATRHND